MLNIILKVVGDVKMQLDLSTIGIEMKNSFQSAWGQGRKCVTSEQFHSAKRMMEGLVKEPTSFGEEPPCDSFRTHLGKDFKYAFGSLVNKKRCRPAGSSDEVVTPSVRR